MSENRNSEIESGLTIVSEQIQILENKFSGAAGQDIETAESPEPSIRPIGILIEMLPTELKGFQDRLRILTERFDTMFNFVDEPGKMIPVTDIGGSVGKGVGKIH